MSAYTSAGRAFFRALVLGFPIGPVLKGVFATFEHGTPAGRVVDGRDGDGLPTGTSGTVCFWRVRFTFGMPGEWRIGPRGAGIVFAALGKTWPPRPRRKGNGGVFPGCGGTARTRGLSREAALIGTGPAEPCGIGALYKEKEKCYTERQEQLR